MTLRANLTTACLLIMLTVAIQAQTRVASDATTLRSGFMAAFGRDFDLVKDKFTTRSNETGGGSYWLAYARPKHTGNFSLQYRYRFNDKLYSHVEHEIHFGVGPKGCRRGPPYAGTYSRVCLGDTLIIPVLAGRFTEHEFKLLKVQPYEDKDWETFAEKHPESADIGLDKTEVRNPASESLLYVGYRSAKMLHRTPGYTIELYAEFAAVKPGRFNLLVSPSPPDLKPGEIAAGSVPIIVVARDTPVTLIAGREDVRGFARGFDGREYESSSSGNSYMTNLIILQPGDRISLRYFSVVRNEGFESGVPGLAAPEDKEKIKPVISVHPFSVGPIYDFTAWLLDELPK
jgi:hypothetical protein